MDKTDFYKKIIVIVNEYIQLSNNMCEILMEIKKALLSFDNFKLNKVLDEKLVMNQQILSVNEKLAVQMNDRYGSYTKESAEKLEAEFPEIVNSWKALQSNMRLLKNHAADIRRVISAIEKYHSAMKVTIESAKPKTYKQKSYYEKR